MEHEGSSGNSQRLFPHPIYLGLVRVRSDLGLNSLRQLPSKTASPIHDLTTGPRRRTAYLDRKYIGHVMPFSLPCAISLLGSYPIDEALSYVFGFLPVPGLSCSFWLLQLTILQPCGPMDSRVPPSKPLTKTGKMITCGSPGYSDRIVMTVVSRSTHGQGMPHP